MELIIGFGLIVLLAFALRLFGAWMFRINNVIEELQEIKQILKNK